MGVFLLNSVIVYPLSNMTLLKAVCLTPIQLLVSYWSSLDCSIWLSFLLVFLRLTILLVIRHTYHDHQPCTYKSNMLYALSHDRIASSKILTHHLSINSERAAIGATVTRYFLFLFIMKKNWLLLTFFDLKMTNNN